MGVSCTRVCASRGRVRVCVSKCCAEVVTRDGGHAQLPSDRELAAGCEPAAGIQRPHQTTGIAAIPGDYPLCSTCTHTLTYPRTRTQTLTCAHPQPAPPSHTHQPTHLPPHTQACSDDCCDCCGRPGCACADSGTCCLSVYATAGETLELVVRAVDVDPFETATIYFTGLQPDPVTNAMPAGVGFPEALPFKYGCGETPYVDCDEEVSVRVK